MIFLADLPNPVHGMANINKSMLNELVRQGSSINVINTAPSYAANLFGKKKWVLVKFFHTIFCFFYLLALLVKNKTSIVYRPINGGVGQVYDLAYIGLCRLFSREIYIHHHSFAYFNSKSQLFSLICRIAGNKANHIVLGEKMQQCLNLFYHIPDSNVTILSNVAFFNSTEIHSNDINSYANSGCDAKLVVGHLANLCLEKGLDDFIDLCRQLKLRGSDFKAKLAGPFYDYESEQLVLKACKEINELEYFGALYGADKDQFFKSLDIFVFPSKYINEAEPLVLYEAGQFGVLNIGTIRGCMGDVICSLNGIALEEQNTISIVMTDSIDNSIKNNLIGQECRKIRVDLFQSIQFDAGRNLANLVLELGNQNVPKIK